MGSLSSKPKYRRMRRPPRWRPPYTGPPYTGPYAPPFFDPDFLPSGRYTPPFSGRYTSSPTDRYRPPMPHPMRGPHRAPSPSMFGPPRRGSFNGPPRRPFIPPLRRSFSGPHHRFTEPPMEPPNFERPRFQRPPFGRAARHSDPRLNRQHQQRHRSGSNLSATQAAGKTKLGGKLFPEVNGIPVDSPQYFHQDAAKFGAGPPPKEGREGKKRGEEGDPLEGFGEEGRNWAKPRGGKKRGGGKGTEYR